MNTQQYEDKNLMHLLVPLVKSPDAGLYMPQIPEQVPRQKNESCTYLHEEVTTVQGKYSILLVYVLSFQDTSGQDWTFIHNNINANDMIRIHQRRWSIQQTCDLFITRITALTARYGNQKSVPRG